VKEIALTMGPEGCYASGDGFEGHVPAPRVDAVDGTGAGDAFAAALIYGKLAGWSFEEAVTLANAAGALATTAVGAFEGVLSLDETREFARMTA
jgi:sugar/nucleoside kinase (ribokinase family)